MADTHAKRLVAGLLLASAAVVSGCATGPQANASDPLEPFNRAMYSFNDTADRVVLKPAAETYQDITPQFVRTTIGNFFLNLGDLSSSLNAALQLRPVEATTNFMRFGDSIRIEMMGRDGASMFGAIEQKVVALHPEALETSALPDKS